MAIGSERKHHVGGNHHDCYPSEVEADEWEHKQTRSIRPEIGGDREYLEQRTWRRVDGTVSIYLTAGDDENRREEEKTGWRCRCTIGSR